MLKVLIVLMIITIGGEVKVATQVLDSPEQCHQLGRSFIAQEFEDLGAQNLGYACHQLPPFSDKRIPTGG